MTSRPGLSPASSFMCNNCVLRRVSSVFFVHVYNWECPLSLRIPRREGLCNLITWGELFDRIGLNAHMVGVLGSFGTTVAPTSLIRWPASVWIQWGSTGPPRGALRSGFCQVIFGMLDPPSRYPDPAPHSAG